jgi:hypothetical protein
MIHLGGAFGHLPHFRATISFERFNLMGTIDTKAVAAALGTEPKILRRFLRDPKSTYAAVGSGSRYNFTENDLPELTRRFQEWSGNKASRPVIVRVPHDQDTQRKKDQAVWDEEGPVCMADIRDPRVRRRVKEVAKAQMDRLDERLLAAGLHISQLRYRDQELAA